MNNKQLKKPANKKWLAMAMIFLFSFIIIAAPTKPAQAQFVFDPANLAQAIKDFFQTKVGKIIQKAGSVAFQRTLSSSLNKIAYDAANYIGSGGKGQSELFVKENLGTYMKRIGDEAAGQFLETFANNLNAKSSGTCAEKTTKCFEACYMQSFPKHEGAVDQYLLDGFVADAQKGDKSRTQYACVQQCLQGATNCAANANTWGLNNTVIDNGLDAQSLNICQPSSIEVKLKISLGLVDQTRPQGPNCTATEMINNWGDDFESKWASIQSGEYMKNIGSIFDPRANDLGIYFLARSDISEKAKYEANIKAEELNRSGGWIDVRNIAGELQGVPDAAQKAEEDARAVRIQSFGKTTGDILVDASNIFLNQLAISAYNNLMRKLADKKSTSGSDAANLIDYNADPSAAFGQSAMKEKTRILIEPKFDTKSDYDILAKLASCVSSENPGPDSCVIDDGFLQAITAKKTVAEAMNEGLLHSNWGVEKNFIVGAQNSHYSLRNVKILRKYRILPLGWEVAIENSVDESGNKRTATLSDLVSCFDQNDEYTTFSSGFDTKNVSWCQGMVDPNWVLKAPLNYCKKEGPGSYVNSSLIIPGVAGIEGQADILSSMALSRSDDYCADNQSCIQENADGSCELYGYCNEEKRTWRFDGDTCSPFSNTCQSFTNTNTNEQVAYLKNTIDYASCNADNAGCASYSLSGRYENGSIAWSPTDTGHFNKNLQSCNPASEGCSQFLRIKPTWGANLLIDGNFAEKGLGASSLDNKLGSWSVSGGSLSIVDANTETGSSIGAAAMKVSGANPVSLLSTKESFPANLQIISGQNYTLSADIYIANADRVVMNLDSQGGNLSKTVTEKNKWQSVSVTASSFDGLSSPSFSVSGYGSGEITFYVANVKFELGDWATSFGAYGSFKLNQKVLPNYLESTCYVDTTSAQKDYRLKSNAPAVCSNYARKCNRDEVGCQLFTGVYDKISVPAKVSSSDYCSGECLGYDVYIAKESAFSSTKAENIIPDLSTSCSQAAVGCSEFTNLDKVAAGGESKEYYSSLKQCIKPDTAKCANFYAWEYGNQIVWQSLQKDASGNPLVNLDGSDKACSEEIYNLPISDPAYNADCRRYTNASGQVSYRSAARVITCSDKCNTYRLSGINTDSSIKTSAACSKANGIWTETNTCIVCKNGGLWDSGQQACLYQAIPEEGQACSASEAGCREYNGSFGNSVRLISSYNFDGGLGSWSSNCSEGLTSSPISNFENGKSIYYNAAANSCGTTSVGRKPLIERVFAIITKNVAKTKVAGLKANQSYTLRFVARAQKDVSFKIYFQDEANGDKSYFLAPGEISNSNYSLKLKGNQEWAIYNVNLPYLQDSGRGDITLNITGDSNEDSFFIDDIVINEISNRYYLIENSSQVPDSCYYDNLGKYQGADYNLGCSQYKDNDSLVHNLHKFSSLCQDSSVGCEQMIDTKNYSSPRSGTWNDTNNNGVCDANEEDCLEIKADEASFIVYDKTKNCLQADLGCSRLGQGSGSGNDLSWSNVYKLNYPDNYDRIICSSEDVGCDTYVNSDNGSVSYFRNPGNNVCVYRESSDPSTPGKYWFKTAAKRCDKNNNGKIDGLEKGAAICSSDADCGISTCILDTNDYSCSVSYLKTIGLGGSGGLVPVPDKSVASCNASFSGCTEYIDPVSQFNTNLVYNPSYNIESGNTEANGWGDSMDMWPSVNGYVLSSVANDEQVVEIERNKLYTFSAKNVSTGAYVSGPSLAFVRDIRILDENNNISTTTNPKLLSLDASSQPIIFHSMDNYSARVKGGKTGINIEIKEISVSYNMASSVDKNSCSGVVGFDNGCVLFNERSINGASGFAKNVFNAASSQNGKAAVSSFGPYSANQLLKVRPDRTCAKWLTCTSYGIDKESGESFCYSMAECNMLDDKNDCANVITYSANQSTSFDPRANKNASGYAIANQYYFNNIKEVGLNSEAHYDFEDTVPPMHCVRKAVTTTYPATNFNNYNCTFDKNIIADTLVREPAGAPTDYPAQGKQYIAVSDSQFISPQNRASYVLLPEEGTYYLNFLVNTKGSQSAAYVQVYKIDDIDSDGKVVNPVDLVPLNLATFRADNGWERKIVKFDVKSNTKIQIMLGTDSTGAGKGGLVYFDDINIEPVLKTADNKLFARDCRLYPTSESLGCYDKDNTVVRNGIEGYCLEYDLANPKVCQLWYPVDKISSTRVNNSNTGYTGKYPLNYCTEVNTNFQLLEKRKAAIVRTESMRRDSDQYLGVRKCYYPTGFSGLSYCKEFFGPNIAANVSTYKQDTKKIYSTTTSSGSITTPSSTDSTYEYGSIIQEVEVTVEDPRTSSEIANEKARNISDEDSESDVLRFCGSTDYFLLRSGDLVQENSSWFKRDDVAVTWICMPLNIVNVKDSSLNRKVPDVGEPIETADGHHTITPFTDGWYVANGFAKAADKSTSGSVGESPSGFNEAYNADPALRILDLNEGIPSGVDGLKKISSLDPDEVFNLTCNKFVEVVSGSGENKAQVYAIGKDSPYVSGATTSLFTIENGVDYRSYVRNLGDVPFGAASWPDDFNLLGSSRVPLLNQYSFKTGSDIFAGRPYGCDASGEGNALNCKRIGYCSANPDIYCLVDETTFGANSGFDLGKQSCGSFGTCKPLWNISDVNYKNTNTRKQLLNGATDKGEYGILKKLFLQAPSAYRFGENGYESTVGYFGTVTGDMFVTPKVSNVNLYYGNSNTKVSGGAGVRKGSYRLEFNTTINLNQQPLKQIIIDWGDGYKQVVSGQDSKPDANNPHVFYHFYTAEKNPIILSISAYDNWNVFGFFWFKF